MKTRFVAMVTAASAAIGLTSCEVTGDPSQGGIFWSEKKAQQRLDERQHNLDKINRDTAAARRSAAYKKRKINQYQ